MSEATVASWTGNSERIGHPPRRTQEPDLRKIVFFALINMLFSYEVKFPVH